MVGHDDFIKKAGNPVYNLSEDEIFIVSLFIGAAIFGLAVYVVVFAFDAPLWDIGKGILASVLAYIIAKQIGVVN